jgi:O-antigen ligase
MFGLLLWLAYASRSRTGFVVLVAGLLVCALYLLRIPGRSIMTGLFLFGLTTLVAGVIALSPDFTSALIQSFTRGQDEANIMGLDGRVSIWSLAIKAFHQSPIVGSGYGTYPIWIGSSGHFHNMFIELMVTTGLAGLIPACIILVGLMWSFLRLFWAAPPKSIAHQILVLDALLMGTAAVLSNQTTAGAAYYSWELIALVLLLTALPVIQKSTKRDRRATKDPVAWVEPFAPMVQLGRPAAYPILGCEAHGVRKILSPRHRQFDGRHGTEAAHAE